jgi:NAD(P)H-quinone oxidoreductase subunit 5
MAAAYVVLQLAAGALFGPDLPAPRAGILDSVVAVLVILGFLALVVLQAGLRTWSANPRLRTLYVHLFNGLYINTLADRLVARIWPVRARSLA